MRGRTVVALFILVWVGIVVLAWRLESTPSACVATGNRLEQWAEANFERVATLDVGTPILVSQPTSHEPGICERTTFKWGPPNEIRTLALDRFDVGVAARVMPTYREDHPFDGEFPEVESYRNGGGHFLFETDCLVVFGFWTESVELPKIRELTALVTDASAAVCFEDSADP